MARRPTCLDRSTASSGRAWWPPGGNSSPHGPSMAHEETRQDNFLARLYTGPRYISPAIAAIIPAFDELMDNRLADAPNRETLSTAFPDLPGGAGVSSGAAADGPQPRHERPDPLL